MEHVNVCSWLTQRINRTGNNAAGTLRRTTVSLPRPGVAADPRSLLLRHPLSV